MKKKSSGCPFCEPYSDGEIILFETDDVCALYDKFPATNGHTLIIPKRHCGSYFDLSNEEQAACWEMVNKLKKMLTEKYQPGGFTIRININEAAGQAIPHAHIHLVPRYNEE